MPPFPDDLWQYLSQHVDSRNTLAALCRASTRQRDIFTPVLYKYIWLDRCPFSIIESIASLPKDSHLQYTERCHLGRRIQIDLGSDDEAMEAMRVMLTKMVNLRSFTLEGRLLRDFADDPSKDSDASDPENDAPERGSPLIHLFNLKHLEEVRLISTYDEIIEFFWEIPLFQGLTTLALHKLERKSWSEDVNDVAEVLLASSGLKSLSLSLMPETGLVNDQLRKLINYFHEKSGGTPLKLSRIHFGLGFLPVAPGWSFPEDDYLDQLTDFSSLVEIRLDNRSTNATGFDIPNFEIHAKLFSNANHVEKISVERLSPDIVELVQLLTEKSVKPKLLGDIEVSRYFETLEPGEAEYWNEVEQGKNLTSVPLEETGFHWRRVAYGMKLSKDRHNTSKDLLQNFIGKCGELQEISIPMNREHLDLFKGSVMSQLRSLHTLMIPGGHIADMELQKRGTHPHNETNKRRKIEHVESERKLDAEHEVQRLELAKEFFEHNRRLRRQDPNISPLRYVGVGTHVYCCLLANSFSTPPLSFSIEGVSGLIKEFQIIKLSPVGSQRE